MSSEPEIAQALASLRQSLAAGRLAHAYLIAGAPRGAAGVLAERVVELLYCTAPGERPCGQCLKCRQIAAHVHPDVLWVEPQKKSRGILTEQINAVQGHIYQTSFEGGWKTVVFMNADRLNKEASNRLLKTIEEPPDRCLLLLVTDQPARLLPTVVSRCQRMVLAAGADASGGELQAAVADALTGIEEQSVAAAVIRARRVLAFLKTERDKITETIKAESEADNNPGEPDAEKVSKDAREARIEAQYREVRAELFRWLLLWQRDVLLRVVGADGPATPAFPEHKELIRRWAAALTYRRALDNIQTIEDMRWQLDQYLPEAMVMERGFIRLTASLAGCRL